MFAIHLQFRRDHQPLIFFRRKCWSHAYSESTAYISIIAACALNIAQYSALVLSDLCTRQVLSEMVRIAKRELQREPRTLFLCGSYSIGKERAIEALCHALDARALVSANKFATLTICQRDLTLYTVEDNGADVRVHVGMLGGVRHDQLRALLHEYKGRFAAVVAFRPTGWSYTRGRKYDKPWVDGQRGETRVYSVPYSEHSSYNELQAYVREIPVDLHPHPCHVQLHCKRRWGPFQDRTLQLLALPIFYLSLLYLPPLKFRRSNLEVTLPCNGPCTYLLSVLWVTDVSKPTVTFSAGFLHSLFSMRAFQWVKIWM